MQATVAHASVASSKPKAELNSHADSCVVGDNWLVIHDHDRPVNVYSYDPKDGHKSAKTVDATVGYQDAQSGQVYLDNKPSHPHRWTSQPSFILKD